MKKEKQERLMTLEEYIKTLHRGIYRGTPTKICKETNRIYQLGYGFRRSHSEIPLPGQILGSFYAFVGGYFFRRFDNGEIIQIYLFTEDYSLRNHKNNWMIE